MHICAIASCKDVAVHIIFSRSRSQNRSYARTIGFNGVIWKFGLTEPRKTANVNYDAMWTRMFYSIIRTRGDSMTEYGTVTRAVGETNFKLLQTDFWFC